MYICKKGGRRAHTHLGIPAYGLVVSFALFGAALVALHRGGGLAERPLAALVLGFGRPLQRNRRRGRRLLLFVLSALRRATENMINEQDFAEVRG